MKLWNSIPAITILFGYIVSVGFRQSWISVIRTFATCKHKKKKLFHRRKARTLPWTVAIASVAAIRPNKTRINPRSLWWNVVNKGETGKLIAAGNAFCPGSMQMGFYSFRQIVSWANPTIAGSIAFEYKKKKEKTKTVRWEEKTKWKMFFLVNIGQERHGGLTRDSTEPIKLCAHINLFMYWKF